MQPTETGTVVTDFLQKYFEGVFNVDFTADMELTLDKIAEKSKDWKNVVAKFWKFLDPLLTTANDGDRVKQEPEKTDIKCEKCGKMMVIRDGKFGKFLGCSNYPTCKNIQPLNPVKIEFKGTCPNCGKRMTERKSKAGKIYYSCEDYENCKFMSWDEPTGKRCPECGEHLIIKRTKDSEKVKCSNKTCKFVQE